MRIIFPGKGDLFSVEGKQVVIADGDTMRVPAQITENRCRASHRVLGVHDLVLTEQRSQERGKRFRVLQRAGWAAEAQFLSAIGAPKASDKLAAKDSAGAPSMRRAVPVKRLFPAFSLVRAMR